ncbi:MAG: sarcosine oxidase, subunit alpha, partial [Gaiellales bacterium]|nr:sarcosine oxidase, subunit alpha [Gaiellales bacterium]
MLFTLSDAIDFEGREIPVEPGDSVASALYRAGVRVFSRSFKYHRRRGLYCLTGDCPNCMVNVDGDPGVRACVTAAEAGQRVRRETGWPSADRDALGVLDRMHRLLPVGFYYKTLLRPRWAWPRVEPLVRRVAGRGTITKLEPPANREARHVHPDVVVIGGGVAGLAAAIAAAEAGRSVLLCDEGRIGEKVAPGPDRARIDELALQAGASGQITLLEQSPAIGIYEGPLVVINAPGLLQLAHPESVIVATGAVDEHGVFPGNDLPGVWLARGAARLAGVHGVLPGRRIVVIGGSGEAERHAATLRAAGAEVTVVEGRVVEARGGKELRGVVIERGSAREERACDALVLALGLVARDGLALQAAGLPVVAVGDAATAGLTLAEAEEQGRRAGRGETAAVAPEAALPEAPREG